MNKLYLLTLIPLILLVPQVSEAANVAITTIQTNFGNAVTSTGIMIFQGDQFINVTATGNTVSFSQSRIYFVGSLTQLEYDHSNPQLYISDQLNFQNQYADNVPHYEIFNGTIARISISPVLNTLSQPLTIELFVNGIDTGKGVTIQPRSMSAINTGINQGFGLNDNVYWKIITTDTNPRSFVFNAQDIIFYHK